MDEPPYDVLRQLVDIGIGPVHCIIFQDSYDLVIGLIMIKKPQHPDRMALNDYIPIRNVIFGKD